jgi:predicted RNase H-like nuclease
MKASKKVQLGRDERLKLLRSIYGAEVDRLVVERRRDICAADDILDALAATWTAARILKGKAVIIPDQRHNDHFGLSMEIAA